MDGPVNVPGASAADLKKVEQKADAAKATADKAMDAVQKFAFSINTVPSQAGSLVYNGNELTPSWNGYNPDQLTIGGTVKGTAAGTYAATFTPKDDYVWADGTQDPVTVNWTIERAAINNTPAQSGTLTFTGAEQAPAWSNYNAAQLTIGGTVKGTNAGTYAATFTPTANYKWSDGSTAAKSANWTIGKAAGSLSLNKTSMTLNKAAMSGEITVTRAGDGAISATSSNTGVATVSVSGDKVTVTGKAYGSVTITVKVADGTNHTAPGSKTCAVQVNVFNTTLNSNTWAAIKAASDAGEGANNWSVGATKAIKINGKVGNTTFSNLAIDVFITGFNHNSSREGTNRIHFQIGKIGGKLVGLVDANYWQGVNGAGYFRANTSNTNAGGWASSDVRKNILGSDASPTSPRANTLLAALPSDLRAVMKSMTKYSDNTGGGSDTASYVTATTDYLPLYSEFEYHGARTYANSAEKNYQAQYDYYKAGNSKVHYKHNDTAAAANVLCRSVHCTTSNSFCLVNTNGTATNVYARVSCALAPGFSV